MPTSDAQKAKEQAKERMRRMRSRRVTPDVTPAADVTPREVAMAEKWGPLAAYMERHPGRVEKISASLATGKVGAEVRFGTSGPTFAEIAKVLG